MRQNTIHLRQFGNSRTSILSTTHYVRVNPMGKVWKHIANLVHLRFMELYVTMQLLLWGIILVLPMDTFSTSITFRVLASVIKEETLGVLMIVLGVLRLTALLVNGMIPRFTPLVRIGGAFIGCFVWFFISVSFAESGVISTWIAAWPLAFFAEFRNLYKAARDLRLAYDRSPSRG